MDTPTDTPLEPQPAPSSWLARARAALTTARDRLTTWWGRVREASPLPSSRGRADGAMSTDGASGRG